MYLHELRPRCKAAKLAGHRAQRGLELGGHLVTGREGGKGGSELESRIEPRPCEGSVMARLPWCGGLPAGGSA